MTLKLAFVLEAVDKATAKVRAVSQVVDKITDPVRRARVAFNSLAEVGGLSRVQQSLSQVRARALGVVDAVRGIGTTMLAVAGVGGAAFWGFKRTADEVDRLNDQAKMLGITTQEYQRLGYAAQLNGSSQEEMADALRFLSRNMTEAVGGSKEAAMWFARVGIPLERLRNMNTLQVFEAIADKFNQVGDAGQNSARKIAVMQGLLGRSGSRLKQVLDQGSAGLRKFYAEADRLGVVLDDGTVQAMADFNDSWDRMRLTVFGAVANLGKSVAPVLQDLIERITEWTSANRGLIATRVEAFVSRVVDRLPGFMTAVIQIGGTLASMAMLLDRVAQALGGWDNVIVGVAGAITGNLLWSLALMAKALWGVGAAFLATPFGWFALGVAGIVAAAALLIKYWEPVKKFFADLWSGITNGAAKVVNMLPSWMRGGRTWGQDAAVSRPVVAPAVTAPSAVRGTSPLLPRTDIGGRLKIEIDSRGQPRVRSLQSNNPAFDLDVYGGQMLLGGG